MGRVGPNGVLRVSAPICYGWRRIEPLFGKYQMMFPNTSAQLYLTDKSDGLLTRNAIAPSWFERRKPPIISPHGFCNPDASSAYIK
ncbi:hypothetical protein EDF70_10659 [Neorhizobium sp. JUb45]|nr:hypothetical protein EDF70_10659 [Neorhizobium sp. JUb45]